MELGSLNRLDRLPAKAKTSTDSIGYKPGLEPHSIQNVQDAIQIYLVFKETGKFQLTQEKTINTLQRQDDTVIRII